MKRVLAMIAAALLPVTIAMTTKPAPVKVVFFGDSITEYGVRPKGYITRISELLKEEGQDKAYELVGAGVGGNKVYDLYLRLEDDVLDKKPDVVFIYVGVNDVWHKQLSQTGTDADKFERFYNALIKKLKAQHCKVILCTPAVIGEKTDYSNPQDGDMNKYANIIRNIATRENCPLVDLRKAFHDYDVQHNPDNKEAGILTVDRVHLNDAGNDLVAKLMLEKLKG